MSLQWECITFSHEGAPVLIEIIPTADHVEGSACWCDPWIAEDCTECEDRGAGCWKCGGRGFVDHMDGVPIFIHHDPRLE